MSPYKSPRMAANLWDVGLFQLWSLVFGQIIATFPAGWSPQKVVKQGNPPPNPPISGLGIIVPCPDIYIAATLSKTGINA